MTVHITISLSGPFADSDAQALQMLATGVAIMAGGELAAQIAANTDAAEQQAAQAIYEFRTQAEAEPEEDTGQTDAGLCGKTQDDPLGGPPQVCVSIIGHRGRHRFRSQEEAADTARLN